MSISKTKGSGQVLSCGVKRVLCSCYQEAGLTYVSRTLTLELRMRSTQPQKQGAAKMLSKVAGLNSQL